MAGARPPRPPHCVGGLAPFGGLSQRRSNKAFLRLPDAPPMAGTLPTRVRGDRKPEVSNQQSAWRVRLSAAKALGNIKDFQPGSQMLAACLVDRNARVRSAAQCALRRHGRVPNMFAVRG